MPRTDKAKKRLAVNPIEAEVVRHIYSLYLAGLGAKAIAERLTSEGYGYGASPGPRTASWTSSPMRPTPGAITSTRRTRRPAASSPRTSGC